MSPARRSSIRPSALKRRTCGWRHEAIDVRGRQFTIRVAEPLHEFEESRERFEGILLLLAAPALLLAAFGGFWLSGRALAPVDRITNEARRISISNLETRLEPPAARDELQRLVLTLNEMLERIDSAVKRMVQFTADASHELRAPLTLIHTAAEFSLRRERTREELLDAMRKIARESDRTSRLVDDLLLLARADSGSGASAPAPVDLCASARNAVEQAVILAEPKGIRVEAHIPARPILVDGDEAALSRLWLILLDNAVKYTNAGGHIRFDLAAADSQAEAKVTDTGVGIAPEELPAHLRPLLAGGQSPVAFHGRRRPGTFDCPVDRAAAPRKHHRALGGGQGIAV